MKSRLKSLSIMFMVLSLSLSVVSCSKDDNNDGKVDNSIVGTWLFKSTSAGEIETNSTTNDEKIKSELIRVSNDDYTESTYTFNSDSTYTIQDEGEPQPFTGSYTLADGILTFIGESATYSLEGVSIENGVMTFKDDYASYFNKMELDQLIKLGITDPTDFNVKKAIANINFTRK